MEATQVEAMHVRDVMTRNPFIITPSSTLKRAAQIMRDCDCGFLPVGEDGRLVGMLTDRDITIRAVAEGYLPESKTVQDVMTKDVQYCFEDDPLKEAAEIMEERKIRRLVVLDRVQRVIGVLSIGDLAARAADGQLVGEIECEVCKAA